MLRLPRDERQNSVTIQDSTPICLPSIGRHPRGDVTLAPSGSRSAQPLAATGLNDRLVAWLAPLSSEIYCELPGLSGCIMTPWGHYQSHDDHFQLQTSPTAVIRTGRGRRWLLDDSLRTSKSFDNSISAAQTETGAGRGAIVG